MGERTTEVSFSGLHSEDRKVRREYLNYILSVVAEKNWKPTKEMMLQIETFLYPCFFDSDHVCREMTIQIVKTLVGTGTGCVQDIAPIICVIQNRIAPKYQFMGERKEEFRIFYVELLREIIKNYEQLNFPCLDDISKILSKSILDTCPQVIIDSCLCAAELAVANNKNFHLVADLLVKPLLKATKYDQSIVYNSAIISLDDVIMYSNGKQVPEVCTSISSLLFDPDFHRRLAIYRVVSNWMLNLRDRHSYFPNLIPLILKAQVDDHLPNREEAERLWDEIGNLYINENIEQFREKLDFLPENLDHYPPNVKRPNLGCRMLVTREVLNLLPVIIRELDDENEVISNKAGQLLCVVALNTEDSIIQHLNQLLTAMTKCCRQPNHAAANHVRRGAEIMSYFISPSIYLKIFIPTMSDTEPHVGHMIILSGLLKNVNPIELSTHMRSIITLLRKPEICKVCDTVFKKYLLQFIQAIEQVCDSCESESQKLFYELYIEKFLNELLEHSPKIAAVHAENVILKSYEVYRQTLTNTSYDLDKDPKFLTKIVVSINTCVDKDIFNEKQLWKILSGIIFPILTFRKKVKTAKTLKTARSLITADSCLCAQIITKKLTCFDETMLNLSFPIFLYLAYDKHCKIRAYALGALHNLVCAAKNVDKINADTIKKITEVALACLNDNPGNTRFEAINLIKATYTQPLPKYYLVCFEDRIANLYKILIKFLDDQDIQRSIHDLLKDLSWMKPDILIKHINVNVFSHKHFAQSLIDYLSDNLSQITLQNNNTKWCADN